MVRTLKRIAVMTMLCCASAQADSTVHTNPLNRDPAVQRGYNQFYNLDYEAAYKTFQEVLAQHPDDPQAIDYVLNIVVFRELYRQDLLDTTLYAHEGFLTAKHVVQPNPQVRNQVDALADRADGLADGALKKNPNDTNALFARGMAKSLKATYLGLAERSFVSGLHLALSARSDDERVLQIDPNYVDAKLVVGIHEYVVGVLPRALKIMAGVFGIHGNKDEGIAMLQDCARRGVITNIEARTTLMIFYRHDARYAEAVQTAQALSQQFPHDYLYALEVANLRKDSGDGAGAVREYRSVLDKAKQPGYYPNIHPELAWFGLGETLRGQNDSNGARQAFQQVLAQPTASADIKKRAQDALNALH